MTDKAITENRKARFNYSISDTWEAGLVLRGTEVKSCRAGKVNLNDGYCAFRGGELYLQNVQISEYSHGNRTNHEPRRARKVLLQARLLEKLYGELQGGASLVPLKMYFKKSFVKVLVGLGKGKKAHDKRENIKKRDAKREIERAMKR